MKLFASLIACLIAFVSAAPQWGNMGMMGRGNMGMGMNGFNRGWGGQPSRTVIIQKEIIRQPGFGGGFNGMGRGGFGWGRK
ncbi:unnamed protein product, partial [Mesorhabditis belari]|uniref:Uncharacterized protein n=1 Tax=Mesorhabditis belari TaxID=2138241 RepID=A0AAF3FSE5_9BILA